MPAQLTDEEASRLQSLRDGFRAGVSLPPMDTIFLFYVIGKLGGMQRHEQRKMAESPKTPKKT
jgi:hypothetical protein